MRARQTAGSALRPACAAARSALAAPGPSASHLFARAASLEASSRSCRCDRVASPIWRVAAMASTANRRCSTMVGDLVSPGFLLHELLRFPVQQIVVVLAETRGAERIAPNKLTRSIRGRAARRSATSTPLSPQHADVLLTPPARPVIKTTENNNEIRRRCPPARWFARAAFRH